MNDESWETKILLRMANYIISTFHKNAIIRYLVFFFHSFYAVFILPSFPLYTPFSVLPIPSILRLLYPLSFSSLFPPSHLLLSIPSFFHIPPPLFFPYRFPLFSESFDLSSSNSFYHRLPLKSGLLICVCRSVRLYVFHILFFA